MDKPRAWYALVVLAIGGSFSLGEELSPSTAAPLEKSVGEDPSSAILLTQAPAPPKQDSPVPPPKQPAKQDVPVPLDTNLFSQAPSDGGESLLGRNPRMIGDFPGYFALRSISVPSTQTIFTLLPQTTFQSQTTFQPQTTIQSFNQTVTTTILVGTAVSNGDGGFTIVKVPTVVQVPVTTQFPVTAQVPVTTQVARTTLVPVTFQVQSASNILVPVFVAAAGAFKIGENESPFPEDRVYFAYDHFNGLQGPNSISQARVEIQQTTINGQPATISTLIPGVLAPRINLDREVFGVEKLILDRQTSIGLRVPLLQPQGDGSFGGNGIGDLTVILKHAFYANPSGSVISGGLAITVPTGQAIETFAGKINPTLIQPFTGYRYSRDRFYMQGFSSLAFSTDNRDVSVLFNDLATGYTVYRGDADRFLSSITPVVEAHLTSPINHMRGDNPVIVPETLAITAGTFVGIYQRSTLTFAISAPVTGPRPFNFEGIVQLNYNY